MGTRRTLAGGAKVAGAVGSQKCRDLESGLGQLGSSEEAGRTDGTRRSAEDGNGRHDGDDGSERASELAC